MSTPPRLFDGIKVLELGQYASVPYCAELFAHGGAEVIKVEPIGGDQTRLNSPIIPGEGRQYVNKSRGKQALAVNLGSEEGRGIVRKLALEADVVLCNMRPGVPEALGLDYESLRAKNPRLIYGEVTAFGHEGPDGGKAGIDPVAQAASGLVASLRSLEGPRTAIADALVTDFMSGTLLAFGVAAALHQRTVTGTGQKVGTSLLQAALALQHQAASMVEATDQWKREFVEWVETEKPPFPEAFERRRELVGINVWWLNTYETSDGLITVGAPGALRRKLVQVLGLPPDLLAVHTTVDTTGERVAGERAIAAAAIAKWPTAELIAALETVGVPCARVNFLEQVLLGEQARANGFVHEFDHPRLGPMILPAPPVAFSGASYAPANTTPAYGEHTGDVLMRLGYTSEEIADLSERGVVGTAAADIG